MTSSQLSSLPRRWSSQRTFSIGRPPQRTIVYYQMTSDKGYIETGISSTQTAVSLAPTEQKLPYTLAVLYSVLAGETKDKSIKHSYEVQAEANAKKALVLKPNYVAAEEFLKKLTTE